MPALFQLSRLLAVMSLIAVTFVMSATVSQAAFPGANGRLAFVDPAGDIHTAKYDGSDQQLLATGATDPRWSPDGSKLVFSRNPGIWVINTDGSAQHQIRASGREPAWSPDGTKIVFSDQVAFPTGTKYRLHVMDADGTDSVQLPVDSEAGPDGFLARPTWSPDGEHIAYLDWTSWGTGLFVVNPDGSDPQVVFPNDGCVCLRNPEWLPDGSRIAYIRFNASASDLHRFTIRPDGTDEVDLGRAAGLNVPIAWSPDGTLYGHGASIWIPETGEVKPPAFGGSISSWQPIPSSAANLALTKSDSPDPAYLGETLEYTIRVTHVTGSQTAASAVVTDTVPSQFPVVSATSTQGSCSTTGQTVTCQLGDVSPAGVVTVTIRSNVAQSANAIFNTANVQASTSDPDPLNNSDTESTSVPNVSGYPRPKGATPFTVALVPAYAQCTMANRTHGPPLAFGSCNPPAQSSSYLTVGTGDANGRATSFVGSERVDVLIGNPQTGADEADVRFAVSLTDIRRTANLADYTGELQTAHTLRLTDKLNGSGDPTTLPATMRDYSFRFAFPCTATANTSIGATCSATTTADALIPGVVQEGKRALWELDQVRVFDGGSDGVASTDDNTVFAKQGLFVP